MAGNMTSRTGRLSRTRLRQWIAIIPRCEARTSSLIWDKGGEEGTICGYQFCNQHKTRYLESVSGGVPVFFGVLHTVAPLSLIFCLVFLVRPCIFSPALGEDGEFDSSDKTLLDLQHRPAPLSLGHTFR